MELQERDEGDAADRSLALAIWELKRRLRDRTGAEASHALPILCHLLAGRRQAEIQALLGLTAAEYASAEQCLREELDGMRR